MFNYCSFRFSADSMQRIKNIENGIRNFPAFAAYNVSHYCYDPRGDVQALEVSNGNECLNLFLFFPGEEGKIASIALYGVNLEGHYNVMRKSMMAFGMPISEINKESGESDYLDIYLEY